MDDRDEYYLTGTMLEVYDQGPFWAGNGGRRVEGSSLSTWLIDEGTIAGVGVSGITLVTLTLAGRGPDGRPGRLILVDEDAHPEQVRWIVDALHGRLGGPLADAACLVAPDLGFYQVPINYRFQQRWTMVDVPRMVKVVVAGLELDGRGAGPSSNRLWPDWSGEASEARIDVVDRRLQDDLSGCPAVRGSFRFQR